MLGLAAVYLGLLMMLPWLSSREPPRPRDRTDLAYWLISPLFTGPIARASTLGAYGLLGFARGQVVRDDFCLLPSACEALRLLGAAQLPLALLLADLLGYLSHRARHHLFWRFHALHHAPRDLRASSAARMHPIDEIADALFIGLILLVAGFDWWTLAALGPITLLYTLITHADVPWAFGPLGRVLVSPRMHRWHHDRGRGADAAVNFAGIFALWDVLFGTFYLPDAGPAEVGTDEEAPRSLWAQLVAPFDPR